MIDKFRKKLLNQRGFTLMELLIVIAIIAILTVAFLPNALNAPKKARDAVRIKKVQDIQTAVEAYVAENSKLPTDAANFCLTKTETDALGMAEVKDDTELNSCETGGEEDRYYFKSDHDNADTTKRHYVIGVKVEVKSNANTDNATVKVTLNTPPAIPGGAAEGTVDAARALIKQKPIAAPGAYYITVGPI